MLAPGEFLTKPDPEKPLPERPAERGAEPTSPADPTAPVTPTLESKADEPQSFLLILLRALGAIHS
jgi:hypothetical protein